MGSEMCIRDSQRRAIAIGIKGSNQVDNVRVLIRCRAERRQNTDARRRVGSDECERDEAHGFILVAFGLSDTGLFHTSYSTARKLEEADPRPRSAAIGCSYP